jgi:anti-sigma factor RsiW
VNTEIPQNARHVVDLLPAYAGGRLEPRETRLVQEHLLHCATCRAELATWETIRDGMHFAAASTPLPPATVLEQALASIDAEPAQSIRQSWQQRLQGQLTHLWLVLTRQVAVIHKSIWYVTPLVILFGCLLVLFGSTEEVFKVRSAQMILSLFITVVGAAGVAFIYGAEHDAGFELTLATPTSTRTVMLCRTALVLGYNIALAALASALVTFVLGGNFWDVIQLWLGPLILLTSVSLLLSLTIGSVVALVASLLLEAIQAIALNFEQGVVTLQLSHSSVWQTNPWLLLLAVVLLAAAALYAPRKVKLQN